MNEFWRVGSFSWATWEREFPIGDLAAAESYAQQLSIERPRMLIYVRRVCGERAFIDSMWRSGRCALRRDD